ncbi:MAG: energy-coupling factor ABC transporter ATP-binding protein [Clostridiales Family XIII bacterium]|jgi:energy-coupling factor transport system ATP-binding protein|nr:energy-coupling factor ABC transporter ATP-binding protein [Clostridiales Family XIII bacterium]
MALIAQNLSFSYRNGMRQNKTHHNIMNHSAKNRQPPAVTPIISNFSESFEPARITAITGANGCGKTTLSKLLVGILQPQFGKVTMDGTDISSMSLSQIGRQIGLVMQNPSRQLFCTSVADEMEFGLKNIGIDDAEINRRKQYYLAYFGLRDYEDQFPFELSTGEKQRLIIAAIVAMKPKYLILDEPTSSLDISRRAELGKLLRRLKDDEGMGILLISHDARFVSTYADEEVCL